MGSLAGQAPTRRRSRGPNSRRRRRSRRRTTGPKKTRSKTARPWTARPGTAPPERRFPPTTPRPTRTSLPPKRRHQIRAKRSSLPPRRRRLPRERRRESRPPRRPTVPPHRLRAPRPRRVQRQQLELSRLFSENRAGLRPHRAGALQTGCASRLLQSTTDLVALLMNRGNHWPRGQAKTDQRGFR